MKIAGEQTRQLKEAILGSFTPDDLATVLWERLNLRMATLASEKLNFANQVSKIIEWFNDRSKVPPFLSVLRSERPDDEALIQLYYEWELHPGFYQSTQDAVLSTGSLEKLVNDQPLLDSQVFLRRMADVVRCVCRVRAPAKGGGLSYGTGFLVGEDWLITNHHVLEAVILDASLAGQVVCKFDYEVEPGGKEVNPGADFGLAAKDPILASSPPSDLDKKGSPLINAPWPADCLDYALVRLAKTAGTMPFGINAQKSSGDKIRGWVAPPPGSVLARGGNIIIVQHPDKEPMKIAIGMGQITGVDDRQRRVRYALNTMEGSSGSPCFDEQLHWIALHNAGDPNGYAKYNQGIVAHRILEDLATKGYSLTGPPSI